MQVRRISISKISPALYNPRQDLGPGDPAYEKLKRSITDYGLVEPLVVNRRNNRLIGGHQRLHVLRALGELEVDVVLVDLDEANERALAVALNQISGRWDMQKLGALLDELVKLPDFDATRTGIDLPDIAAIIAEALHTDLEDKEESFNPEAAVDTDHPPVTKRGELIELGRHRVLCGDSANPRDVQRLLQHEKVHLLLGDPPYNVAYLGGNRPNPSKARPKRSREWRRIYADNLSHREYTDWLRRILTDIKDHLLPGAPFYLWNGHRNFGPMHFMLEALGFHVSCVLTWVKPSFAIGFGDFNEQSEFCLYGWLPKDDKGGHFWYGPTNETTVWEVKRDPTSSYLHPTQKPLLLSERGIRDSTRPGNLVLDPFLGSGSTLIACERTGRRCYGLEIDPHFVDVVVRRYIAFVGADAVDPQLAQRYATHCTDLHTNTEQIP
ncbi:MAG: DNA modification methylase [Planctomycetes bacterium]|nr:DNA modification methylase [Planctomycetota bacterium]